MMSTFAEFRNIAGFLSGHPLTRDHRLAALGRFLRWQIRSRMKDEVIVDWIQGTRLAVRRGMTGATGNIYAGLHEFHDMAFALHFLRAEDVFADVGANVGSYTMLASGVAGARSIAFEPDPYTAERLQRNVELNGLSGRVDIRVTAVGDNIGWIAFSIGLDTANRVVARGDPGARSVPVTTLDAALNGQSPALLKLDVEGYEAEILRGAGATLTNEKLKAVLTENQCSEVVGILEHSGFRQYCYDGFEHAITGARSGAMSNALFVRDEAFVRHRVEKGARISVLNQVV